MTDIAHNKLAHAEAIMKEDATILAALATNDREQIMVAREIMERRKDALSALSRFDGRLAE
jgi:hypothetical protein